jgi:8-oxo-dGTP pyrophosphatase MutT (NUDIX family)
MEKGVKKSFGIACVRRRPTGSLELLVIRKKYTYAFTDFVHGRYRSDQDIVKMLNKMSTDEKYSIMTMNFNEMYHRVMGVAKPTPLEPSGMETKLATKFMLTFGRAPTGDGGLPAMIRASSQYQAEWEIPKGHRKKTENDIDTAIREFGEETGVPRSAYQLVPGFVAHHSFIQNGVKYAYTFYLAIYTTDAKVHLDIGSSQGEEVGELQWLDLSTLAIIDKQKWISPIAKKAFAYVKEYAPHL